jgi:hypothetical protein
MIEFIIDLMFCIFKVKHGEQTYVGREHNFESNQPEAYHLHSSGWLLPNLYSRILYLSLEAKCSNGIHFYLHKV